MDLNTNCIMSDHMEILENATIMDEGLVATPFEVTENSSVMASLRSDHMEILENATIMDEGIVATPSHTPFEVSESPALPEVSLRSDHLEILENATIMDEGIMTTPFEGAESPVPEAPLTAAPFGISENATIVEEGLRLCPLCQSEIRLFFVNFNEKLLMCENTDCEYPFGHEDLQFFKEVNDASPDEIVSVQSTRALDTPSATCSVVSAAAWLEIDKINRAYESEDSQFDIKTQDKTKQKEIEEIEVERERENIICKNVEDLKELSRELGQINSTNKQRIKNEKWIKNLMNIQAMSGMSLLKPEEIQALKKQTTVLGLGELKIDIDTNNANSMSVVNIKIMNSGDASEKNTIQ